MVINILELLEKSAVMYADKIAVKDIEKECTFSALCNSAQKIGSSLDLWQIFGKTIPVYMEKSILTLEVFFGIVYAGGCYTLINPIHPKDKVEKLLNIVSSPIVITNRDMADVLQKVHFKGKILLAEDLLNAEINKERLSSIREKMIDTTPLYVNFTSGSTGEPKGVVVAHKSVIEFMSFFTSIFHITSDDIIGNQAPFDFDVSVKDIYSMVMTGATMYIIPKEYFAFPKKILDIIEQEKITTLIWAVSALCVITSLRSFSYKIPKTIHKVLFSGEVMPVRHLTEWIRVLPDAMFVNLYGPTEITCNCTYYIVDNKNIDEKVIPIGKAFPNEKVFLLDGCQEVCVSNTPGEICVAGNTLALGYFKDAETTKNVFVQNPLNADYCEMIYHTGDMAYYQEDGNLVYIGRKDFQIKHLGHRIELGEIESYISEIREIERACCLYDEHADKIIAFYQGNAEKKNIKAELRKNLIKYMMPDQYVSVESMPLTRNGKIDRKKLKKEFCEEKYDEAGHFKAIRKR